jgi:putative membrane protein
MMLKSLFPAVAVAALLGACASSDPYPYPDAVVGTAAMADPAMAMAAPRSAMDYVQMAASGDLFEIESSRLFLARSQHPALRAHAQMMMNDHPRLSNALMMAAARGGLQPPPPAMLPKHVDMLNRLSAASPAQLDMLYYQMQLDAHNEALQVHGGYASAGDNPALREAATAAVPAVEMHLKMLRDMRM